MAGDWIKVEHVTPGKPEIDALAEALDINVNEVIGALVRLWIWADQQTIDGNALSVTKKAIDRHSGVTGLADALLSPDVSWLAEHETGGFFFPNFHLHNGQTAKQRALTAKRVAKCKKRKGNDEVTPAPLPREEKRREEKKLPNGNSPLTPQGENDSFALQQGVIPEPADDPASIDAEFAEFYAAYPKKQKRGEARKAFSKAIGKVPGSRIIERALAYASSVYVTSRLGTDDERYIPLPATWLNAESYNDDPRNWNIPRKVHDNGQSRARTGPGQVFDPTIAHSTEPFRVHDRRKQREASSINGGAMAAADRTVANAGSNPAT